MLRKNFSKVLIIAFFLLFFPFISKGAVLYLDPSQAQFGLGDQFGVKIRIDSEGECVNAINADLSFPKDILKIVDINLGNSIINVWLKRPTSLDVEEMNRTGKISLSGGIPGGYCGRIKGDPGLSDIIGEIQFSVPSMVVGGIKENSAEVKFLDSSKVLLNDGLGTEAKLTTRPASFKISPQPGTTTVSEWRQKVREDKIRPEVFEIEIHKDPSIFDGKYFIVFSTTDKETGIDHYEVAEVPPGEEKVSWERAESPYLLKDQNLQSKILVKAVDKADNQRIVELGAQNPAPILPAESTSSNTIWSKINKVVFISVGLLLALIVIIILIYLIYRKKKKKNNMPL